MTADMDEASRRASVTSSSTMLRRQQQLEAEEEANRGITLSYRFKNLTTCPVSEWNATDNITTIMLSNNCLTMIPDELCNLPFLRTLSLSTNQIASINPNIVNLVTLQTLNLSANQLTTAAVDEVDWSLMGSLRTLYLIRNKLTAFPKSVLDTEIETLSLSDNLIETIPPEINTMAHLQWIGLSNNKISSLDPLFTLHPLSGVTIAGNPITETDGLKRKLRHLTRTMRLSAPETSESPLEFMNRARTMTQQLERQLVRELARHSVISPNAPGASPNSPLVVAGSPFNVFRPMTPPGTSPHGSGDRRQRRRQRRSVVASFMPRRGQRSGSGTPRHAGGGNGAGTGNMGSGSGSGSGMSLEKAGMNAMRSASAGSMTDAVVGSRPGVSPLSAAATTVKPSGGPGEAAESMKMCESPQKLVAVMGEAGCSDAGTIRRKESLEV
ncbi:hypothetical protein BCR44DRAFT_1445889 [Catenaria anguillulae PL171]|uniref:Uncharacterized protein n=1 Tax=Catenaria anguillulae PL171 TaxID=765915 RepID=A0A1Y2H6G0_9FUNG|nr:hypothetical protein BCR44DRAFT_1445889 [Catenaria anguillulae PL171]